MEPTEAQNLQQPQAEQVQLSTETPPPEKPSRFTKKVKIIIAVVVVIGIFLIAVIAGAFWFTSSNQTPTNENKLEKTSTPTPTPDTTVNWKTYEGNGFTFNFPSNLYKDTNATAFLRLSPLEIYDITDYEKIGYEIIVSTGSSTIDINTLEENYKQIHATDVNFNITRIKIDNIEALRITSCSGFFSSQIECIIVLNDSKIYEIEITYHNNNSVIKNQGKDAFNQILSSFKFTDSDND